MLSIPRDRYYVSAVDSCSKSAVIHVYLVHFMLKAYISSFITSAMLSTAFDRSIVPPCSYVGAVQAASKTSGIFSFRIQLLIS